MSVREPTRSAAHSPFQWLGGLASSLRRAVGRRDHAIPESVPWSAYDRLQLVVRQHQRAAIGGEHRSRQRAPSPDFADYRPYQHGDDIRRIDWNVYGRLGVLQIRQTEALLRVPMTLLLDCSASMHWGEPDKLEFAANLATALARIALARSDSVGIHCLGHEDASLGPLSGIRQFGSVEALFGSIKPVGRIDLTATAATVLRTNPSVRARRGLVVLISDLCGVSEPGELFATLREWSASAVVLHVVSRDEAEPEALGDVDLVDSETGEIVEVGLSADTIRQYRERYRSWINGLQQRAESRGVLYVRCSTERSVPEVVLSDLRARGIVR